MIRDAALRATRTGAWWIALMTVVITGRTARAQDAADEDQPQPPRREDRADGDKPPPNRFGMSVGAGLAGYKLYGVSIGGGALEAVLGGNVRHVTLAADLEGFSGSTQFGLSTNMFTVGMLVEGDFERFRLGGGFRLGTLHVDRATSQGSMQAATFGLFMRATFDVVRFDNDRDAVYLALKLNTETVGGAFYGLTLGVGVRF